MLNDWRFWRRKGNDRDKAELLAAIKANRKTHAELLQEAKEGYLAACVERLQEMLNLAKKGLDSWVNGSRESYKRLRQN